MKKQKVEERIPILSRHGGPATELDGLYEIVTAIAVLVEATNTQTTALIDMINAQTEAIGEVAATLRGTNEILIQRGLREKDEMLNPMAARAMGVKTVREARIKIETAKKRLSRKA